MISFNTPKATKQTITPNAPKKPNMESVRRKLIFT